MIVRVAVPDRYRQQQRISEEIEASKRRKVISRQFIMSHSSLFRQEQIDDILHAARAHAQDRIAHLKKLERAEQSAEETRQNCINIFDAACSTPRKRACFFPRL